ncbi:short-chain dehydrogenase/reductase family 42E member 1 isoform X1 [Paramormyrops kingsleyae]|uniref:Short chain dehydrogenase/reductase family 42E, member 1 n=2 Tax=Paramormyrops kingsleyae TaxID=1676925 RepID=A0A3B3RNL3_9TELE|nr:short-chain dehydrogenase/reductase family 42E member 1 isoform X1 [Paramormyrops kingsleyae]
MQEVESRLTTGRSRSAPRKKERLSKEAGDSAMDHQDGMAIGPFLITGGGGYFGFRLACALHRNGAKVTLFDIRPPDVEVPDGMEFLQGDIRMYKQVEEVTRGVDCVFHIASFGMSGREQLNRGLIEAVNVQGTEHVIKACTENSVPHLVYTSTYNVVFGGQVIENGDESLPYLPLHLHPDHYSRTKSLAEMAVLKANGIALRDGSGILRTCALRPAGIYGPGEQRHQPRIVSYIEKGIFRFVYGNASSLVEFVHVDNLVSAHKLAAVALTSRGQHRAAGQAYFISDGRPVNNFEFFRPLVEGLGYNFPRVRLPISLIYFFAFLTEMVHCLVGRLYNFQPLLTRTEVYKTGVTHYFSIAKAKVDLGYQPKEFNLNEVVHWFRSRGHGKQPASSFMRFVRDIVLVIFVSVAILSCLPVVGGLPDIF